MTLTWMLGSIAFAALTALAALAAERALVAVGLPRRASTTLRRSALISTACVQEFPLAAART